MIRIIAGKYKGKIIPTKKNADYRPSTAKFREAIFNILSSGKFVDSNFLANSNVLDLFAGSGSLAFEAISRGAEYATLIDVNAEYLKLAKKFIEQLNEQDKVNCLRLSAINLPKSIKKYNLIFLDPPYNENLVTKSLSSLENNDWIEDNAIIIIETSKREDYIISNSYTEIDKRIYNNNKLIILKYVKA